MSIKPPVSDGGLFRWPAGFGFAERRVASYGRKMTETEPSARRDRRARRRWAIAGVALAVLAAFALLRRSERVPTAWSLATDEVFVGHGSDGSFFTAAKSDPENDGLATFALRRRAIADGSLLDGPAEVGVSGERWDGFALTHLFDVFEFGGGRLLMAASIASPDDPGEPPNRILAADGWAGVGESFVVESLDPALRWGTYPYDGHGDYARRGDLVVWGRLDDLARGSVAAYEVRRLDPETLEATPLHAAETIEPIVAATADRSRLVVRREDPASPGTDDWVLIEPPPPNAPGETARETVLGRALSRTLFLGAGEAAFLSDGTLLRPFETDQSLPGRAEVGWAVQRVGEPPKRIEATRMPLRGDEIAASTIEIDGPSRTAAMVLYTSRRVSIGQSDAIALAVTRLSDPLGETATHRVVPIDSGFVAGWLKTTDIAAVAIRGFSDDGRLLLMQTYATDAAGYVQPSGILAIDVETILAE